MAMAASRGQPAQHIAAEWVWTRCRPRYSQMPASGSSAFLAARLPSVSRSRNNALVAGPRQAAVEEHRHGGENDAAVGIVLRLADRGVADPHRAVAEIAFEIRGRALLDVGLSAPRCRAGAAPGPASRRCDRVKEMNSSIVRVAPMRLSAWTTKYASRSQQ